MTDALVARDIVMRFGGVLALDGAAVEVARGRIVGLIGRNGSGKSTMFNCITGFLRPTEGSIALEGTPITGLPPHQVVRAGVARSFQTPRVDMRATVREAVLCGFYALGRVGFLASVLGLPSAAREEARLAAQADAVLDRLGLAALAGQQIGKLSMGQVRLVEVARGIAAGARYLLLDEPAAGLTQHERDTLAATLRDVAAAGVGVLLVEHNFSFVRTLCETITVLEAGRVLAVGSGDEIARDRRVVEGYLGSDPAALAAPTGAMPS
ncbi:MAG: ABC transporter ATP-binding protein [Reyranellaceae bacterium]